MNRASRRNKKTTKVAIAVLGLSILSSGSIATSPHISATPSVVQLEGQAACLDGTALLVDTNEPQGFLCVKFPLPWLVRDKWDNLADCETGDRYYDKRAQRWVFITGSAKWHFDGRFDGGIQFDPGTWVSNGGREFAKFAYQATPAEQKVVGERTLKGQGRGAWPWCSAHGAW